jgi:hypothetical protein
MSRSLSLALRLAPFTSPRVTAAALRLARHQGVVALVELPASLEAAHLLCSASRDGTLALWDPHRGTTPSRPPSSAASVRSPRAVDADRARLLDKVLNKHIKIKPA